MPLNLALRALGPCTEAQLAARLLWLQGGCCAGTFLLRHAIAGWWR